MSDDWMTFVDGENFAIRGKATAEAAKVPLVSSPFYCPNTFLWGPMISTDGLASYLNLGPHIYGPARRSFYYTAVQGDDAKITSVKEKLKYLGFMPRVFKKTGGRSKRVDITLVTDALSNAHFGNYGAALFIAGDADYIPLVEEIQRMGKIVVVAFFEGAGSGLSPDLALSADRFVPLDQLIWDHWRSWLQEREAES